MQRKVKFPFEFDVLSEGMLTEDLKLKMAPVNARLKEIERERLERMKVRRKTRKNVSVEDTDVRMGDAGSSLQSEAPKPSVEDDLPDEKLTRAKEKEELEALVHTDLKADVGANVTGVYELVGMGL